jgi:hypothetical protein
VALVVAVAVFKSLIIRRDRVSDQKVLMLDTFAHWGVQ